MNGKKVYYAAKRSLFERIAFEACSLHSPDVILCVDWAQSTN